MDIKKVLVTGSDGLIGTAVAEDLYTHGYQITCVDKHPTRKWGTKTVDCEDLGQIVGVMQGHDAVIHMAAIPNPLRDPAQVVFRNNAVSTYNILEAAAILGVKNVVLASSISALGMVNMVQSFNPLCIPIDETHPLLSQDAYGLSKMVGELLADGFSRRIPDMSLASLRFTVIVNDYVREYFIGSDLKDDQMIKEHAGLFWTYVDLRDSATACRLAMENNKPGHEAFYITAPHIFVDGSVEELLAKYFPGDYPVAEYIRGKTSPVDCSKAERELGWKAKYHWDGTEL